MKCQICNTTYYHQTETDPPESCWCGAEVSQYEHLWEYYGWRGYRDKIRWRLAQVLINMEEWILAKILRII